MTVNDSAKPYVVTIDGLAGVGKSTVAREVARRLGLMHLNSGAIYRAIAFKALAGGISLEDEAALVDVANRSRFTFHLDDRGQSAQSGAGKKTRFLLDGKDQMVELLTDEISRESSRVAVHPKVRDVANEVQRTVAKSQPVVVEGRDIGTVVFPDAAFKFFLTASARTRALRRYRQVSGGSAGPVDEQALERLTSEIEERDKRDETRACAPTIQAEDAILLDTSELSADEVVERIFQRVNNQPS